MVTRTKGRIHERRGFMNITRLLEKIFLDIYTLKHGNTDFQIITECVNNLCEKEEKKYTHL